MYITLTQLEHNLASVFLKMQTVLNISESALREIIQQIGQVFQLSESLIFSVVEELFKRHYPDIDNAVVEEVVCALKSTNVFLKHTSAGGSLSTSSRRATYIEFPVVEPVEFFIDSQGQNIVYIPLIKMLQALLSKDDVLDKALATDSSTRLEYNNYRDGSHFKENAFLAEDEFRIALGLYIDDFEVANPLGASKKKHKLCIVYWFLANLNPKYRSSLHAIQLAVLCRVNTVTEKGYLEVLPPFIQDLVSPEENGVYVQKLGASIKGIVLCDAADNLAAYALAGFQQSFIVEQMCRFCRATRKEIQTKNVGSGFYKLRTKDAQDRQLQEVKEDPSKVALYAVKSECVLCASLKYFHAVDGFPPDILHEFFGGSGPI